MDAPGNLANLNFSQLKERFEQRFGYPPLFDTKKDESTLKWLSRVNNGPQEVPWSSPRNTQSAAHVYTLRQVLRQAEAAATAAPLQGAANSAAEHVPPVRPGSQSKTATSGPELLYRCDMELSDQLIDLVDAFEQAPSARGALQVSEIFKANVPDDLVASWHAQKRILEDRNKDPNFPKPTWQDNTPEKEHLDAETRAALCREREEVAWQLLSMSHRHEGGVRSCRVYHGCPSWQVATSICRTGFANVAQTSGWFGEGLYTTLHAPCALRYGLGMRDFWEKPGETGWVIVAKMVYLQVYPVTEADDSAPSEPGLKGKAIGKASGARGCDCQFVCVRGHPPQGKHKNRHYLACKHGERPEATEIVISQEIRLLPEYVVKVEVTNDGELCKRIQQAAENWGRYASSDADSSAEAASSTDDSNQQHKMELRRRLNETEKT